MFQKFRVMKNGVVAKLDVTMRMQSVADSLGP